MTRLIDLTGQKFGRLTVLYLSTVKIKGDVKWVCECSCGKRHEARSSALRHFGVKSCGCWRSDISRKRQYKHGKTGSKIYCVWGHMKRRCLDRNDRLYPYYGGRGITLCKRWLKFENFYKDMGDKPVKMSLERIDNEKGYNPKNCKWATQTEQVRNRRNSKLIFEDVVHIIRLRRLGLTYKEIGNRYNIGQGHAWRIVKGKLWPEACKSYKVRKYHEDYCI